jgi:hypothetical protein
VAAGTSAAQGCPPLYPLAMRELGTRRPVTTAILCATLVLTACAAKPLAQPSWPAPSNPMALATLAGLEPTDREYLLTHTHSHLDVFVDGRRVKVPSGIGIDISAPTGIQKSATPDATGTQYFVTICEAACLSPLHTHDPTGIIHTEAKVANQHPYTLGQFFIEWGVRLDDSCVGEFCKSNTTIDVFVDGKKATGNPADIQLKSHLEIAIVIGKAPAFIPDSWDFGELP